MINWSCDLAASNELKCSTCEAQNHPSLAGSIYIRCNRAANRLHFIVVEYSREDKLRGFGSSAIQIL